MKKTSNVKKDLSKIKRDLRRLEKYVLGYINEKDKDNTGTLNEYLLDFWEVDRRLDNILEFVSKQEGV